MNSTKLPLRENVCMLVFNGQQRIFLGERKDVPGHYQFPQGGVEPGYSLEENVIRELEEEIGAPPEALQIIKRLKHTNQYDWEKVPDYALGKWRGQAQTFWLVKFSGHDSDLDLNRHKAEFRSWRWCTLQEVYQVADPRRLKGYGGALEEFAEYLRETALTA